MLLYFFQCLENLANWNKKNPSSDYWFYYWLVLTGHIPVHHLDLHSISGPNYCWQDCPDTGRSTGAYIILYQGGPIDHGTHVPGPVAQYIAESEYNSACTAVMALAHFRMLIHELLNKDPDIVTEESPLIVLDSKYYMCMAKNGKDTKHTRHIARIMHFVRNGEKFKMHKIDWCEGGLQLVDIGTKNVSEPDITPRMKYIMVRLEN